MSIPRATPSLLTAAILVLAPLPFGSTHAWTVSVLEVALFRPPRHGLMVW